MHDQLAEAGCYAVTVPEEYGGLGMDSVTEAIILEQIGEVNKGFGAALTTLKATSAVCNRCPVLRMAHAALDEATEYTKPAVSLTNASSTTRASVSCLPI